MAVALLATLSIGVSSCSDDDKYSPATDESIVGTWACDWAYDEEEDDYPWRDVLTFGADGSYTDTYQEQRDGEIESGKTYTGSWSLNGDKLTLNLGSQGTEVYECYISGNTLKLVERDWDDEVYEMFYHRQK